MLECDLTETPLKKSRSITHTHPLGSVATLPYLPHAVSADNKSKSRFHRAHAFHDASWSWQAARALQTQVIHLREGSDKYLRAVMRTLNPASRVE